MAGAALCALELQISLHAQHLSADCLAGAVAHKTKACYVGMVPSSSKFCPPVADKRFATFEWHLLRSNYTVRVAHKKGLLRLVMKGLLQCFTGCMTRFPNHLERVLPRKCRPKYPKTRTKDQRMRGPRDQRTKGPEDQGTRGPTNQRSKGPEEQGTRGPKDQGTREPRLFLTLRRTRPQSRSGPTRH